MKKRLQVFVSSTYLDLKEERQAAVSAILKAGHIPAGMELFTAGDKSQLEIIKRWIDESDVYMLILGGRYGSVEESSGVSYTELEYNYAVEQGKPLFAIVITDQALEKKVKKIGTLAMEKERPVELKLFKELVLSNMSSFYDDEKDIRLAVMESLPEIAATRELSGWVSGSEIPDTKGLVDEISKLNKEIANLVNENSELSKKLSSVKGGTNSREEEFEELSKLLLKTVLDIPGKVVGKEKGIDLTLFDLFLFIKDVLITGITNRAGISDSDNFVYHNICPKLLVHDLVQNEKVPNVQYRRFAITKKGQEFLAFLEKKKLLGDK